MKMSFFLSYILDVSRHSPLTIDDVLSEFAEDRNDVESTDIENEQVDEVESTSLTCPSLAELDEAIEVLSRLSFIFRRSGIKSLSVEVGSEVKYEKTPKVSTGNNYVIFFYRLKSEIYMLSQKYQSR